jgi:hypothetical protein
VKNTLNEQKYCLGILFNAALFDAGAFGICSATALKRAAVESERFLWLLITFLKTDTYLAMAAAWTAS